MHGLTLAFFGSSLVSTYWNGAATYWRGILRALHARGHRVTFYEPDAYDRPKHRDLPDPDWAEVVVYSGTDEREAMRQLERARAADVVVKASGIGVFDELLEHAVLAARRPGALAIFWDLDAPATIERLQRRTADPFRNLLPRYDFVFTCGGGESVVRDYVALGARACAPVHAALDPHTHFPVPPVESMKADLVLLANRFPDRETRVEELFFRAAALLPDRSFLLGGSGWQDKPRPSNVDWLGHVYTAGHNSLHSSATAVLNVGRGSRARYASSPPARVFEAAGAAACILTDSWEGVDRFLEPGREILIAPSGEEVAILVEGLGKKRARVIGEAARRRVVGEHTYAHRARLVEELLTGERSRP